MSHDLSSASAGEGTIVGTLFRQKAYEGDRSGALALLDQNRAILPCPKQPNNAGSWNMLLLVVEGLIALGEREQAAELYPLALQLLETGTIYIWTVPRFSQTIAGAAAAAGRQWEAAEQHFRMASQQAQHFPHRLERTEIDRFHAMMLLDRDGRGDRGRARTLLIEAQTGYVRFGMPRHSGMAQALLGGG